MTTPVSVPGVTGPVPAAYAAPMEAFVQGIQLVNKLVESPNGSGNDPRLAQLFGGEGLDAIKHVINGMRGASGGNEAEKISSETITFVQGISVGSSMATFKACDSNDTSPYYVATGQPVPKSDMGLVALIGKETMLKTARGNWVLVVGNNSSVISGACPI